MFLSILNEFYTWCIDVTSNHGVNMKANEVMETLKTLFPIKRTVFIEGAPGGGKTTIVRDVAKQLGVEYVEVHMPTTLVEDLGIPMPQPDGTVKHILPAWIPVVGGEYHGKKVIVCLDDFGQASQDIQKTVANMVQGRTHHGYDLIDDVMFVMTGNRQSDRAGVNRRLSHLSNRLTVMTLDTDLANWLEWAQGNGVEGLVQAFMQFRPDLLHDFNPQKEQNPTPRSWVEGVSDILPLFDNDKDSIPLQECIMGAVGEGAGSEFVGFLRTYADLPKPEEILKSPNTAMIPEKPDVMCALIASICTVADKHAVNFIKYLTRLINEDRAEYSILGLKMAQSKHTTEPFIAIGQEYTDLLVNVHKYVQS